jgi:hypothetical protein
MRAGVQSPAETSTASLERPPRRGLVVRRLVIVAVLAFAGRSLYVLTVLQQQEYPEFSAETVGPARSYDEIYYTGAARALADGDGFRFGVGEPAQEQGIHPPMTSVALAPVAWLTDDELPMRLLVAAVGALVVLLAGLVALNVAGPRAAYIAAGLAVIHPNLWMNDGLLMSESFAAAGTAAAIWCTYRLLETWSWRWAAGVGVACAVAMLSRSELALLVPALVVPAVLLARTAPTSRRILHATLACSVAGLVVAPWVLYNLQRFEEPVLLSHGDGNVFIGGHGIAAAAYRPRAIRGDAADGGQQDHDRFGRCTDPMGAVEQHRCDEHGHRGDGEPPAGLRAVVVRASCPPEGDPTDDSHGREHPPSGNASPHRPSGLLLAPVQSGERAEAVQVGAAAEAGQHHHRHPPGVAGDEVCAQVPPLPGADRRVHRVEGGHLENAPDIPAADVDVVRLVAVRPEQRRAVVRRQQHGPLEPGEVVEDPRSHRQRSCADDEQRHERPVRVTA